MDESIHIDTGLLREQVSVVREEKRIALELQSQVEKLKRTGDESSVAYYNDLLDRIEILVQYYGRMSDALETVGDDAVLLYRNLAQTLEDEKDAAKDTINHVFL